VTLTFSAAYILLEIDLLTQLIVNLLGSIVGIFGISIILQNISESDQEKEKE